ncbi:MAG: aminoglycoside phosphotransferase (APT) family kinase protein [Spirosomataceae bacterium]|jgi:aminoglycoside phosphotransferase (APT) family kinase protein
MEVGSNKSVDVRSNEEINIEELNALLTAKNQVVGNVLSIRQFPGGFSNLTYLVETDTTNLVLRRPPAGAKHIKGGHDMMREYRLLEAIKKSGFEQVPNPVFLSEGDNFLDAPFYLMEKVDGVIFRASDAPNLLKTQPPETFKAISIALCDTLVDLHSIDIVKTDLVSIGKPEGYITRQVEGWYKRYEKSQTDDLPVIKELYDWLIKNIPTEQTPTLIHNDFKYDNVVLNPENLSEIRAILDWEMTTVGDPLMDVGTALSYWCEARDDDFTKTFNLSWLPGNLTRQEFAARYEAKSGRDLSNILYYYAFGLFKNSVVLQQIYNRFKLGLTKDPRFGSLIFGVKVLSTKAAKSIEKNRME